MTLHRAFDVLSEVVERFERRGQSVRDFEATTDSERAGALEVSMTMPVSLCAASSGTLDSSFTLQRASLTESGDVTVAVSVSDLLPELSTTETVVDIDERAVHVDDGTLVVAVGFRIEPAAAAATDDVAPNEAPSPDANGAASEGAEAGTDDTLAARLLAARADDVPAEDVASDTEHSREGGGENEAADDGDDAGLAARLASARSNDVPAYEDTDYLRLLYESCGTFTEMRDRIDMDVAAETVRRYMIEADIHSPMSYDTNVRDASNDDDSHDETDHADYEGPEPASPTGDSETTLERASSEPPPNATEDTSAEQFVTDGVGLPDGVALEDIVTAVVDATAVYEVQRSLDLGYGETRDVLDQLNLLGLVLHRIDDRPEELSKNDVVERIRQCEPGGV